ncbi:uncharacterized protein LODBEIA_P32980 [Lodderomyces beijingensis]|uniref:DUF1765-domain-containing protein n=1 Tax=Lodderomyces beijingensis TaxID=1775926 RepID=A0ABP0ZLQ4_9ASCO
MRSTSSNTNLQGEDKLIKELLKKYKKLELALNKFNSKKYNHAGNATNGAVLKGNLLRTSLIPFLRSANQLEQYFAKDSKIYQSLTSVVLAILIKWWNSLIGNLTYTGSSAAGLNTCISHEPVHYSLIPASDRNAYLECISRIISRDDWSQYDENEANDHQTLLIATLDFCIDRLSTLKTLSGSMAAFIGKVFAYSFYRIPEVSNALLFLLNVKQITLESFYKIVPGVTDIEKLRSLFPVHLHYLLDFKGVQNLSTRGQRCYMNCMPPPQHPVAGIKNPNGDWVRRWCGSDSNVFNSFLRHYVDIAQKLVEEEEADFNVVIGCPGFNIILSHVFQIFQVAVSRITANISTNIGSKVTSSSLPVLPRTTEESLVPPLPPPSPLSINIKQSDMYYSSIIKIFKTVRDVTYCATAKEKTIDCISASLVKVIDLCFISIAKETSVYDFNKNGLILAVINEFLNHLENNSSAEVKYLINWEFWLSCNYMMIQHADHTQSLLKNFAFLFNIWDMIPDALCSFVKGVEEKTIETVRMDEKFRWITNLEDSFKLNFVNYLIKDETFETFFTHWNPLVRSYYIKLLVWRIIGINNYQSSTSIQTTRTLQMKLNQSFETLSGFTMVNNGRMQLNYKPDSPLVNRKFGILPISKDDYLIDNLSDIYLPATAMKTSELRKTHPYEIFDEAIYTCSTVPSTTPSETNVLDTTPSATPPAKNNSLVSSIGKLLRILSDGDDDDNDKNNNSNKDKDDEEAFTLKRNAVSSSSLSASSFKSRSSSPSIMSLNSAPTSNTESSSAKSDSDSILTIDTLKLQKEPLQDMEDNAQSYNIQPPELSKLPPKIIRPIFKFDIIVCHESMNEKYQMINHKNMNRMYVPQVQMTMPQTLFFPHHPQLPYISLFLNSDLEDHKLFLNEEDDGIFLEKMYSNKTAGSIPSDLSSMSGSMSMSMSASPSLSRMNSITMSKSTSRSAVATSTLSSIREKNKSTLFAQPTLIKMINLGKSINELNIVVEEFRGYLNSRIEIDSLNRDDSDASSPTNEFIYFKKIIPFLSVDPSNEMKLLNAS